MNLKILVVYYSYTGNTEEAAHCLCETLREGGNVAEELPLEFKEEGSLILKAFKAVSCGLLPVRHDPVNIKGYDVLFVGTPVWGCSPSPAVNAFIDGLPDCSGKIAIPFVTSGGHGWKLALSRLSRRLEEKGCMVKKGFSMKGKKELTTEDVKRIHDWVKKLGVMP